MRIKIKFDEKEYFIPLPDKKRVQGAAKTCKTVVSEGVSQLKSDVKTVRERDPAARSDAEVLLLYPCLVIGNFIGCNFYRFVAPKQ